MDQAITCIDSLAWWQLHSVGMVIHYWHYRVTGAMAVMVYMTWRMRPFKKDVFLWMHKTIRRRFFIKTDLSTAKSIKRQQITFTFHSRGDAALVVGGLSHLRGNIHSISGCGGDTAASMVAHAMISNCKHNVTLAKLYDDTMVLWIIHTSLLHQVHNLMEKWSTQPIKRTSHVGYQNCM